MASEKWRLTLKFAVPNDIPHRAQEITNDIAEAVGAVGGGSRVTASKFSPSELQLDLLLVPVPAAPVQAEEIIKTVTRRHNLLFLDSTLFNLGSQRFLELGGGGPAGAVLSSRSVADRVPGGPVGLRGVKVRV